jgi:hypothetical protein
MTRADRSRAFPDTDVGRREHQRRQGLKGVGMERADWLEEKVNAADARFLMVTAITHHRFSSPIWGAREVRKLHAELAEIAKHASEVLKEHQAGGKKQKKQKKPRSTAKYRGVFGAPAW